MSRFAPLSHFAYYHTKGEYFDFNMEWHGIDISLTMIMYMFYVL